MAKIGCFIEQYNIRDNDELSALSNFRWAAIDKGHDFQFIFRADISRITDFDAIFIRASTDPQNASYLVSRLAADYGLTVIDDPRSIAICCNKIHMYRLLMKQNVPIPDTTMINKDEVEDIGRIKELFETHGKPLVLKAPATSFSKHVEKVETVAQFRRIAKRFFRRADQIVVQRFMKSDFDWRVGILGGKVLYVCKYHMPEGSWKIKKVVDNKITWGKVEAIERSTANKELIRVALQAGNAIGKGLYGIDIKERDGKYYVIEVNDNPSIDAHNEDAANPEIYSEIIDFLANKGVYKQKTLDVFKNGINGRNGLEKTNTKTNTNNAVGQIKHNLEKSDYTERKNKHGKGVIKIHN